MVLESEPQRSRGSVVIAGHDWPVSIELFLAQEGYWTPLSLRVEKDPSEAAVSQSLSLSQSQSLLQPRPRPRPKSTVSHYSASFSKLQTGNLPYQKPLPILFKPSSTTTASSCPSLEGSANSSLSNGVPANFCHGRLPPRPASTTLSISKTNAVLEAGSWSASVPTPAPAQPLSQPLSQPQPPAHKAALKVDQPEPRIFESTREVLGDDPAYAERIVRTVRDLPEDKQSILLGAHSDLNAGSDPVDGGGGDDAAQTPGQGSTNVGSGSNPNQSRKRKSRDGKHDDPNNEKSSDGSGRGNGSTGSGGHTGKKQKNSGRHYACHYSLAFHISFAKNRLFQSCRPPGYMRKRSDLTKHLKDVHSPSAQADDPDGKDNAQYYMTTEQSDKVSEELKKANRERCDEDTQEWFEKELRVYLAIWDTIFPNTKFPSLSKPTSPFHLDATKQPGLQQQGKIMFEAIYSVRVQIAVESGRIRPEEYQPSRDEYMDMLSQAFAIVTNTDSAVSARIISMPTNELQDAAMRVAGASGVMAAADRATGGTPQTHTPSSDPIMMETSASSPDTAAEPAPAAPSRQGLTMELPLDYPLTDIQLVVADNTHDTEQRPLTVKVTVPPGAILQTFNQKPVDKQPVEQNPIKQQLPQHQPLNQQSFHEQLPNQWSIDQQVFSQQLFNQSWLNGQSLQTNVVNAGSQVTQTVPPSTHAHSIDHNTLQGLEHLRNEIASLKDAT